MGIYLYDARSDRIAYVAGANLPEELTRDGDPILESLPIKEVAQKGIVKFGEHLQTGKDKATRALHKLQPEWESTICVPLQEGSNASGVLLVFSKKPVVFSEDERILFEQVGKQLGQAIVNTRLHQKVRTQAITDALTGAYNRHYLDDFLNIEVKRCQRYQRPLALVLLDMDDFKGCNEKGGHQAGDKALKDVVQLLNIGVRSVDLVTRYGGDEFLMVLPETDRDGALEAAERMRSLIEKHRFPCGQLTASLGVAASPFKDGDAPSAQEMIGRADKALFKAKETRRNKVEMWKKDEG